jgi:hypothetical protein
MSSARSLPDRLTLLNAALLLLVAGAAWIGVLVQSASMTDMGSGSLGGAAMAAFGLERMDLARGDGTEFSDPEMRHWKSGGEGTITNFSWSA